jgi:peptide/nickel transport system substrate-binding protein
MRRLSVLTAVIALFSLALVACAGEETIVEKIVTVEVVKTVEVVREVEVEKIVTVEVVKEVEVVREVEVEVEKVVTVERVVIATPTPLPITGGPVYGGTLRVVSQSSISVLDPVFTLFAVVGRLTSHFYEELFEWDADLVPQPKLVDTWSVSADGREWTFKLRGGVPFHNGDVMNAGDAVASLQRWRLASGPGSSLVRRFTDEDSLQVVDDLTFTWSLFEPIGVMLDMLSSPHPLLPIVPAEVAATPYTEAVEDHTGTGVYKFVSWDFGDKITLERFDDYASRSEPSTGPGAYAGENIAYIDRLIWLEIPDEETKIAGLETGEWDVVDGAGFDFFKRLTDNPEIQVPQYRPGHRSDVMLNPNVPPFSFQKARQALMAAADIEAFMFSLGDPDLWELCDAFYWCGTPFDVRAGSPYDVDTSAGTFSIGYNGKNMAAAQALLADSDYAGETTVILNPTDYGTITPIGHVLKPLMEEIGFITEMPALDWATITGRFGATDSYSAITSWYEHFALGNPALDLFISGSLDFLIKDDVLVELQLAFTSETDPAKQIELVKQMSIRRWEVVPDLTLGVWFPIIPSTSDLKNMGIKAMPFFVNTWFER